MDLGPAECPSDEVGVQAPVEGHLILQVEQDVDPGVGEDQGLRQLPGGQRAGGVAVEVEHPESDRAHLQWEGEDRLDAGVDGCRPEGRPPTLRGRAQLGLQHGTTTGRRVDAGALTQAELQVLRRRGPGVGGGYQPHVTLSGHEGEADSADGKGGIARGTKGLGQRGRQRVPGHDIGQDLVDAPTRHRSVRLRLTLGMSRHQVWGVGRAVPRRIDPGRGSIVSDPSDRASDQAPLDTSPCWCDFVSYATDAWPCPDPAEHAGRAVCGGATVVSAPRTLPSSAERAERDGAATTVSSWGCLPRWQRVVPTAEGMSPSP